MWVVTTIAAVRGVLPPHRYPQEQLTEAFAELCGLTPRAAGVMRRLHANCGVGSRHLAVPIDGYAALDSFGAANDAFIVHAVELGAQAIIEALEAAGLRVGDVDVIVSTTVTGLAVPSLDARIAAGIGLRPDVKRLPLVGLGCVAGAAGVARLHDLLRGSPHGVGVLVSTELCSLTVQRNDSSAANMVASGLFGDGAAAVVAVGDRHDLAESGPRVIATASHLYPNTERAMGWDVGASGLKVVLGAEVPELVRRHLADDVGAVLAGAGIAQSDVARWICHPGGPKVILAVQDALGLSRSDVQLTWDSLHEVGNLSSSSVLHVFADTLKQRPALTGDAGVLMAMGPGFCSELVLLRW